MSGFSFTGPVACTPSVIPAPTSTVEPIVTNDGWFPDIDPAAVRNTQRITDKVTPARLRNAIIGAMMTVGNDLAAWRIGVILATASASLAAVPAAQLDGQSRLLLLYRRAIGCYAKAEVVERNRDIDTTAPGLARAADLDPTVDELRRDALHAIRDMMGVGRADIELI